MDIAYILALKGIVSRTSFAICITRTSTNSRPTAAAERDFDVVTVDGAIQIRQHMEFNDLFDTFQSAYRSAVHIQDDILKALDCGKHIILVLLDISPAFDSVDHDILIDKLPMIGVRGDALCWVESYLSAARKSSGLARLRHSPSIYRMGCHKAVYSDRCFLIYTATISAVYLSNTVPIIICTLTTPSCMLRYHVTSQSGLPTASTVVYRT